MVHIRKIRFLSPQRTSVNRGFAEKMALRKLLFLLPCLPTGRSAVKVFHNTIKRTTEQRFTKKSFPTIPEKLEWWEMKTKMRINNLKAIPYSKLHGVITGSFYLGASIRIHRIFERIDSRIKTC